MTPEPDPHEETRWSRIRERDFEYLAGRFWKPVRRFFYERLGSADAAEDLTQDLFLSFVERDTLERADRAKGPFRRLLFQCARNFLADWHRSRGAAKRGAGRTTGLDDAPEGAGSSADDPAEAFDRDWFRSIYNRGRRAVKEHYLGRNRPEVYRAFRLFYFGDETPDRWTQARIAEALGATVTQVNNHIHRARQVFLEAVRSAIAEYTASDEELAAELGEMARLLGDEGGLAEPSSGQGPAEGAPEGD